MVVVNNRGIPNNNKDTHNKTRGVTSKEVTSSKVTELLNKDTALLKVATT